MPRHAISVLTSRAIRTPHRTQYVCQACLEVARSRAFHTTPRAAEPLWQRLRDSILGTKEAVEKADRREEKIQAAKASQIAVPVPEEGEGELKEIKQEEDFQPKRIAGTEYQVARIVDPEVERLYSEAQTGATLRTIGGEKWVKEQTDSGLKYRSGVTRQRKRLSNEELALLLRHIFVEVHILVKNERKAMDLINARDATAFNWGTTQNAEIEVSNDGRDVDIGFLKPEHQNSIVRAILHERTSDVDQQKKQTDKLFKAIARRNATFKNNADSMAWMKASFTDPSIRLAVTKYITQLTGLRPSDFALSTARTFEDLYKTLRVKAPAKKLADAPQMQALSLDLPNVTVYNKRRGILNKEDEVGRWKLIEKELLDRGLPLGVGEKALRKFRTAQ